MLVHLGRMNKELSLAESRTGRPRSGKLSKSEPVTDETMKQSV